MSENMQNHQYGPLSIAKALHCLSMWTRSHSRPLSGPVAVSDAKGHLQATTVQGLARVGQGIS